MACTTRRLSLRSQSKEEVLLRCDTTTEECWTGLNFLYIPLPLPLHIRHHIITQSAHLLIYNYVLFYFLISIHSHSIHCHKVEKQQPPSHRPAHLENQINQGAPRPQPQAAKSAHHKHENRINRASRNMTNRSTPLPPSTATN